MLKKILLKEFFTGKNKSNLFVVIIGFLVVLNKKANSHSRFAEQTNRQNVCIM